MNKSLRILSLVSFFLVKALSAKDAYNITIKINGYQNRVVLLGYYYGDKQYIRDSAKCDITGKFVFKGKEPLDGGVYLLATPDRRLLFDFVVTETEFTLETDS